MRPRLLPPTPLTFRSILSRPPLPSLSPIASRSQPPIKAPPPSGLRPSRRPFSTTPPKPFLSSLLPDLPPAPVTTLSAAKTLPYPALQIYKIIADINAYKHFLPHCTHSLVTSYTPSTNLPKTGDLTVGWGPFTQSYTSRVFCIPGQTVEAVSGNAGPTIPPEVLRQHGYEVGGEQDRKGLEGGLFESLCTKWTVREAGEGTEVKLIVTFQFSNPAVGLAVQGVADEMVGKMISAFEGRARELYGRGGGGAMAQAQRV
ncbi:dehydrase and lipid transport-domain-containing protein [Triangularia setosa]|uniref:Dehydrase and lipid transport-domain-containing protein n=1 Tax=Triangularia setosa TaxID=2587417 RepID=A0AAN6WD75_9PEZI|nr:dehydrase and lipid transport-domain-containing protein [Podospora setosa]